MEKEEIEEAIMASLDWNDIPFGSYTVKIRKTMLELEVELIEE